MRIENVICSCGSDDPNASVIGLVKSAHTYCGLAITIMQITPRTSCTQRCMSASEGFGNRRAVLARIRRAGIHSRAVVAHDALSAADQTREAALQIDLVSFVGQRPTRR